MKKATENDNRIAYSEPKIEVVVLGDSDIITSSSIVGFGFWGQEHDFGAMYEEVEW